MELIKFDAPFGPLPELRAYLVPRWGIISMSRKQSVAEHSYNVAIIVGWLCAVVRMDDADTLMAVQHALMHDADEVYTGDIPSPSKNRSLAPNAGIKALIKLADHIDAYSFAKQYCNDTEDVKSWLLSGLKMKINKTLSEAANNMPISYSDIKALLGE